MNPYDFLPTPRAAALLLAAAATFGSPARSATLDDVVRAALRSYPSLLVARANRDVASFDVARARAQHYPTVDVLGNRRLGGDEAIPGQALNVAQPRARLNLYASGAIEAQVERENWREQSLASRELETREDVAFATTSAYLRLVRAYRLRDATLRSLDRHQRLADDFQAIASIDAGRRGDLVQARSRLEVVRLQLTDRDAEIAAAAEALRRFYPEPLGADAVALPPPPADPAESSMQAMLDSHPSVEAARREVLSAEANIRAQKASRLPRLDLDAIAGRFNAQFVTLSWPAFDLGRAAAEDAAGAALSGARANVDDQQRIVAERQRTAWQEWQAARRREEVAGGQIRLADELVAVYRDQFRIGRRNLLDLLNAFNELSAAELAYEAARVDIALSRLRIDYAAGRLSARFDQPVIAPATRERTEDRR